MGRMDAGRGGRAGRAGGGSQGEGGGGARRFLVLLGVEPPPGAGLVKGVELLLGDMTLFWTTTGRDPSNRVDQLGAPLSSSS